MSDAHKHWSKLTVYAIYGSRRIDIDRTATCNAGGELR